MNRSNPTIHRAELLSVGTELLLGEIVDSNSAWLAASLARSSVDVYWSTRVGDNLERIGEAVTAALGRSDLLVVTGGLGPTDDDLTREGIARALGETPRVDEALERTLRERFAGYDRPMPAGNLKQAWLIPSAAPLANPRGSAPGWFVRTVQGGGERLVVALPGPPHEMEAMWVDEVLPRLRLPESSFYRRTFKTSGLGESALAERLGELTRSANPSVATYAKRDGVHVRVAAKAASEAEAKTLAAPAEAVIERELGSFVWGEGDDELASLVVATLRERGATLALAEGASGGAIANALSGVSGASDVLKGSVVAWSVEAMATLVTSRQLPAHSDGDDPAVAGATGTTEPIVALAEAARTLFGADYGVANGQETGLRAHEGAPQRYRTTVAVTGPAGQRTETLSLAALGGTWRGERVTLSALTLLLSLLR